MLAQIVTTRARKTFAVKLATSIYEEIRIPSINHTSTVFKDSDV